MFLNNMEKFILKNGLIVTGERSATGSILICGGIIEDIIYDGSRNAPDISGKSAHGYQIIDASGKTVMAGAIDAHVHFREPGLTGKADIGSESAAALAGGVTSFIDMPNTVPPATNALMLKEKLEAARKSSLINYGFHIGATNDNCDSIMHLILYGDAGIGASDFGGIKIFMGSSTGNMLVDNPESLEKFFGIKEKPILVHCEDEKIIKENLASAKEKFGDDIPFREHENIRSRRACIVSTMAAVEKAMRLGTRLHVLHVSTEEEAEMIRAAKLTNPGITAETSANYLWFCDEDYDRLGSRCKCNPSIKTAGDRSALRKALKNGIIDAIGSDHAPHTAAEKAGKYTAVPSGLPSIQQQFPALLTIAAQENIPLEKIARAVSERPAEIFGIEKRGFLKKGYFADIAVIDNGRCQEVTSESSLYKCGWSPYEGAEFSAVVETVFVNGRKIMENGKITDTASRGRQLKFN